MTKSYPAMRTILPAYFTQNFSLDYSTVFEAADAILRDYASNPRLACMLTEMQGALTNERQMGADFFAALGVDTIPCSSTAETVALFKYFIARFERNR